MCGNATPFFPSAAAPCAICCWYSWYFNKSGRVASNTPFSQEFLFFFSEIELITHEIAAIEKTITKIIR
jgi:hypothetical protein